MNRSDPSSPSVPESSPANLPPDASDQQIALRMADANCNRVMEGLRTLEDIARFNDRHALQAEYKSLRHALLRALSDWDRFGMLAARNSKHDVGRTEKQSSELDRSSGLASIVSAAAGRSEQGLRVLEEIAKFLAPDSAPSIEAIRYRIYDINARMQLETHRDIDFLRRARLYVLIDCKLPTDEFAKRVQVISDAGVDMVQIRDKEVDTLTVVKYTKVALECLDSHRTRVVVNDRSDIACLTNAWGVHVGHEDLPPASVRSIMRSHQIVGQSTHDLLQLDAAIESRVDYIGCGPTFPSSTKSFAAFAGLEFLRAAAEHLARLQCDLPAFAIGGIDADNLEQVLRTGISRVAVSSAIWKADDPARATQSIRAVLDGSPCGRVSSKTLH